MTLSISISNEAESTLRARAAAVGKDVAAYAAELLEAAAKRENLDTLLAPLREEFAASGVNDDELVAQITEARDAYRKQK